jgi:hypothetical protein
MGAVAAQMRRFDYWQINPAIALIACGIDDRAGAPNHGVGEERGST